MHKIQSFEDKMANNNDLWTFKVLKSIYIHCRWHKYYILSISEASEWVVQAGDAFQGYIPFTQSPWTISPHSNQVAVHLLFYSFTTTSSHLCTCIVCKLCSLSVSKVCFIYFITSNCFLVVFCISGSPKSPGWHASHLHHQHKPSNEASPCVTPIDN